ncbi:MAG: hypothetical protein IV100_08805 [Myxococcales bacterium]|nr:hypothetical protein [Myxococcales bacterium]
MQERDLFDTPAKALNRVVARVCSLFHDALMDVATGPWIGLPRYEWIGRRNAYRALSAGCAHSHAALVAQVRDGWRSISPRSALLCSRATEAPYGAGSLPHGKSAFDMPKCVGRAGAPHPYVLGQLALRDGLAFANSPLLKGILLDTPDPRDADLIATVTWEPGPERERIRKKLLAWQKKHPKDAAIQAALLSITPRLP